jgi:hypothetical protein
MRNSPNSFIDGGAADIVACIRAKKLAKVDYRRVREGLVTKWREHQIELHRQRFPDEPFDPGDCRLPDFELEHDYGDGSELSRLSRLAKGFPNTKQTASTYTGSLSENLRLQREGKL